MLPSRRRTGSGPTARSSKSAIRSWARMSTSGWLPGAFLFPRSLHVRSPAHGHQHGRRAKTARRTGGPRPAAMRLLNRLAHRSPMPLTHQLAGPRPRHRSQSQKRTTRRKRRTRRRRIRRRARVTARKARMRERGRRTKRRRKRRRTRESLVRWSSRVSKRKCKTKPPRLAVSRLSSCSLQWAPGWLLCSWTSRSRLLLDPRRGSPRSTNRALASPTSLPPSVPKPSWQTISWRLPSVGWGYRWRSSRSLCQKTNPRRERCLRAPPSSGHKPPLSTRFSMLRRGRHLMRFLSSSARRAVR
mmetsp:Transcript_25874/g.60590  ORF Transcript_25874/g.60590 Transcript_25874/m.60590 type:complete len:300 (-) Transcript_25874:982-1881(-)